MNTLEFRELSLTNLDEIIDLRVRPVQSDLVADNLYSIAQAGLDPSGKCRAVYMDNRPVGFFFLRECERGTLVYICRFMVDQLWQGRGIGRRIMTQLVDVLFSSPQVEVVDLAVSKGPGGAEEFYRKCGFVPTGEPYRGGWRMLLRRSDYCPHTHAEPDAGANRFVIL
ncbi:MAG: GNAT family N-acetyltransferase [Planctomycetaceae bacterium]|nr:GNAT family N-acetyltransferase [Planctomycetaceae bacterium]